MHSNLQDDPDTSGSRWKGHCCSAASDLKEELSRRLLSLAQCTFLKEEANFVRSNDIHATLEVLRDYATMIACLGKQQFLAFHFCSLGGKESSSSASGFVLKV